MIIYFAVMKEFKREKKKALKIQVVYLVKIFNLHVPNLSHP
jgi:hypothetical protein